LYERTNLQSQGWASGDEIAFYKERFNARFAEGFRKGQESVNPTESPPPTPTAPD